MNKIVLSSDQLPPGLPDAKRYALWRDLFQANVAEIDYRRSEAPFRAHFEFAQFDAVGIGQGSGTLVRATHGRARSSSRTRDHFGLWLNADISPHRVRYRNHEVIAMPGAAVLVSSVEPGDFASNSPSNVWSLIDLPKSALLNAVRHAEDQVGIELRPDSEAIRMVRGYAYLVMRSEVSDPKLAAHVAQTLTDLIALALGAGKEAGEIAGQRGMRAARLEAIVQAIAAGYRDPAFSVAAVARKLKMSERYVQSLLHDTGTGFSERVLELRLQHAAELLARADAAGRKLSDIAFACGFADMSYFHRCFRRRFGMSPSDLRVH